MKNSAINTKKEHELPPDENKGEIKLLLSLIQKLQLQIKEMEANRFWKLKNFYDKIKLHPDLYKEDTKPKSLFKKFLFLISAPGRKAIRKFFLIVFKNLYLWLEENPSSPNTIISPANHSYQLWLNRNFPRPIDLENYKKNIPFLEYKPLISIIVPVYNTYLDYFIPMIESVKNQVYENWELCIADDCSDNKMLRATLLKYSEEDPRIKVVFRKENGHIAACSNSALEIATGDYTGLLDHDDLLTPDALYEVVLHLNTNRKTDFIYSDEDKLEINGTLSDPHFKPDWCPENFLSRNYISHFAVIRTSLMKMVGGFRTGFEGSQDYDLYLRITEMTDKIHHIPKILYHWRMHQESTALNESAKDYAYVAGVKALKEALTRRGEEGQVSRIHNLPGFYNIRLKVKDEKKVSIIISTKDKAAILKTCLESIYKQSTYRNIEIILINNNSTEVELEKLIVNYRTTHPETFFDYRYDIPFNFSALMNYAVSKSTGEYLLFLNNDTEVITPYWIEALIGQTQRKEIGVVGAKLLYPNNTIQHAGVIIGLGGVAGHAFVGKNITDFGYFYYLVSMNNFSALTGACFMCRRETYLQVNGFDERLMVEYNDVDFCLKVRELGYRNVYLPEVVLYHHESISRGNPLATEESRLRHEKEVALFKQKWSNYISHDPCYSKNLSLDYTDFRIRN